jgi:hypothetical protein
LAAWSSLKISAMEGPLSSSTEGARPLLLRRFVRLW